MRPTIILLALASLALPLRAQWQIQDGHTTASFRGIHSLGNGVAWASGTEGTVLRTENGGQHWLHCAIPPDADKLDFRGIQAFDAKTAIVMSSGKGDLSRLYKTDDGCQTWKLVFTNPDKEGFWDAIQFVDAKRFPKDKDFGMLLGDPVEGIFAIFLTFDHGEHWERQLKQAPHASAGEAIFAASNSSLSIHHPIFRGFVTGGPLGSRFLQFVERDAYVRPGAREFYGPGTRLWDVGKLPMATGTSAGAFSVGSRSRGTSDEVNEVEVIVGGDYQHPESTAGTAAYGAALWWQPSQTPPHGYRSSVAYDRTTKTWITVGPNGTDISTDDGRNWRPLRPGPGEAPDTDQHWNALSLPFVVGPHGRIGRLNPQALKPIQ